MHNRIRSFELSFNQLLRCGSNINRRILFAIIWSFSGEIYQLLCSIISGCDDKYEITDILSLDRSCRSTVIGFLSVWWCGASVFPWVIGLFSSTVRWRVSTYDQLDQPSGTCITVSDYGAFLPHSWSSTMISPLKTRIFRAGMDRLHGISIFWSESDMRSSMKLVVRVTCRKW